MARKRIEVDGAAVRRPNDGEKSPLGGPTTASNSGSTSTRPIVAASSEDLRPRARDWDHESGTVLFAPG